MNFILLCTSSVHSNYINGGLLFNKIDCNLVIDFHLADNFRKPSTLQQASLLYPQLSIKITISNKVSKEPGGNILCF